MKTNKNFKLGVIMLLAVLVFMLAGCQKDVVNNAKSLVSDVEKQGSALKKDTDYTQRAKKLKDKAFSFSASDKALEQKTVLGFEKAQTAVQQIQDKTIQKDLDNRLAKVQLTINQAKLLEKAVNDGKKFEDNKTAFAKYVSSNPLSADIDKKLADFQKQEDTMNKFIGTIKDKDLANELKTAVVGDSDQQIQTAKTVISVRNDLNNLSTLITNNGSQTDITNKNNEVNTLIAGITDSSVKTALTSKQNDVLQPYIVKNGVNAQVVLAPSASTSSSSTSSGTTSSSGTKTTATVTSSSGTKTTTASSGGTTSSTTSSHPTTTSSGSSTSSGSTTSTPPPAVSLNAVAQKMAPVCQSYGYGVMNNTNSSGACIDSKRYAVLIAGDGIAQLSKSIYPVGLIADVVIALGSPDSRSELLNLANQLNGHTNMSINTSSGQNVSIDGGSRIAITY